MLSRKLITNLVQAIKYIKPRENLIPPKTARHLNTYTTIQKQIMPLSQEQRSVELITGNFSYLTKQDAQAIKARLTHNNVLVLMFDRDTIPVPANERAMWLRDYCQYHPNLEVRIAYGAPAETTDNKDDYVAYLKKQLPAHGQIAQVRCNHDYSKLLAQSLGVPYQPIPQLEQAKTTEQAISQHPGEYQDKLLPAVAKRVIAPFQQLIDEHDFKQLCDRQIAVVKQELAQLNPNHPNQDSFFTRTRWDLTALNNINLPVVIGAVDHQYRLGFSQRTNTQVFDMPVYMPGQGWRIPMELAPYKHTIAKIVAAETLANSSINDCNAYITVDCGVVFPNGYARREGLHVDGFLTKANARPGKDGVIWGDNTYIVSDAQALQTEFYPGPFDLSKIDIDDAQAVLNALENQGRKMRYQQANAYQIVKLTTNNVHAVHPNLSGHYLERCFVKMTFSERLFNRGGNTINPNFNYRFMYVPRSTGRNTQNFMGITPEGFIDVDLRVIDFKASTLPSWLSATPFWVRKKPDVVISAIPALEREFLETKIDNHIITTNIARAGDMKVTRADGDSYFLGANFNKLYQPQGSANHYVPTPRRLKAARVEKNISFLASWGTRQTIPAGGCIVQDDQGDTWGVHQQSFAATYNMI